MAGCYSNLCFSSELSNSSFVSILFFMDQLKNAFVRWAQISVQPQCFHLYDIFPFFGVLGVLFSSKEFLMLMLITRSPGIVTSVLSV